MKNKDLKKGKESIIGKIIYGFLLFMPLLAILSTILVNTFNQKANETTETTIVEVPYYYETNEITTYEDFRADCAYHWGNYWESDTSIPSFTLFNAKILNTSYANSDATIRYNSSGKLVLDITGTGQVNMNSGIFDFAIISINSQLNQIPSNLLSHFSECETQYIKGYTYDEVITYVQNDIFYYAVDKVENSNLFNWATNSLIYTGIANTCTQLSITTTFIPLLLAYWLIISVIYILYDIILMILIILHNRIHRLQESI